MVDSEQADAGPQPAAPEDLGQLLRSARLAQDLTLEQLSTELRIEAKQLEALEANRFEQIGVPVFIKGYLKQYGTRLGLDHADLLALYYKQTTLGEVQIQPSRTIKLHDERQITSWVLAAIILLAVVVALAFWWWNGGGFGDLSLPLSEPVTAPAGGTTPAAPEPSSAPAADASPASAADAPLAATPAPAVTADPALAEPPGTQPAQAASPSAAEPLLPPAAPADGVAPVAASDDDRAVPVGVIPLEFSFDAETWVEVSDGRGERVLFGLQSAGRTVTVRGEPPFAVVLGNAGSVRLLVDGAPFAIPTGRRGDVARFSVDVAEE